MNKGWSWRTCLSDPKSEGSVGGNGDSCQPRQSRPALGCQYTCTLGWSAAVCKCVSVCLCVCVWGGVHACERVFPTKLGNIRGCVPVDILNTQTVRNAEHRVIRKTDRGQNRHACTHSQSHTGTHTHTQ